MLNTEELLYIKELLQEDQSETATTIKDKIEELTKDTGECICEYCESEREDVEWVYLTKQWIIESKLLIKKQNIW